METRIVMAPSVALLAVVAAAAGCTLDQKEQVGERIFNDPNLSANRNQSCAACHSVDTGGTAPEADVNQHGAVYEGSVAGRYGDRKPPASAYATLAPIFDHDPEFGFFGGSFWDGRATGWRLGSPAAEQAQGPFLNPLEQALPDATELVSRVCNADYGQLFRRVWGEAACEDTDTGYTAIGRSVAAYEGSRVISQFSSKLDWTRAGHASLSGLEEQGLELFQGQGRCSNCHVLGEGEEVGAITDFTFDNIGMPRNPENPFYEMDEVLVDGSPINPLGDAWVDPGLGGFLDGLTQDGAWRELPYVTAAMRSLDDETLASLAVASRGKHRVPTLRNVDLRPSPDFVKAYGHNGFFKSLKSIVHFYNTRDVLPRCPGDFTEPEALAADCWPAPEVTENVNTVELGNLGLTDDDEDALVAFLGTLSDGWRPPSKD